MHFCKCVLTEFWNVLESFLSASSISLPWPIAAPLSWVKNIACNAGKVSGSSTQNKTIKT